jgi:hypothetical protein
MMYYYWLNGRKRPSFFYNLPPGELKIIQAFWEMEIDSLDAAVGGGEK